MPPPPSQADSDSSGRRGDGRGDRRGCANAGVEEHRPRSSWRTLARPLPTQALRRARAAETTAMFTPEERGVSSVGRGGFRDDRAAANVSATASTGGAASAAGGSRGQHGTADADADRVAAGDCGVVGEVLHGENGLCNFVGKGEGGGGDGFC